MAAHPDPALLLLRDACACAGGEMPWASLLPRQAATVHGHAALLVRSSSPTELAGRYPLNLDPEMALRYAVEAPQVDVYLHEIKRRHPRMEPGVTWNSDALLPRGHLLASRYYTDYFLTQDVGRGIGAIVEGGDPQDGGRSTMMVLLRPLHSGPSLRPIKPAWRPSGRTWRGRCASSGGWPWRTRPRPRRRSWGRVARCAPLAMMILGAHRRVRWLNGAADALLRRQPTLLRSGRLTASRPAQAAALDRALAVRAAPTASIATPLTLRLAGEAGHGVLAALEPPTATASRGAVAVVFLAGEHPRVEVDAPSLQGLYGPTAAEAQMSMALGSGLSPEAIAARRQVSLCTLRTQLRAIYMKTGTANQACLRLLLARVKPQ